MASIGSTQEYLGFNPIYLLVVLPLLLVVGFGLAIFKCPRLLTCTCRLAESEKTPNAPTTSGISRFFKIPAVRRQVREHPC